MSWRPDGWDFEKIKLDAMTRYDLGELLKKEEDWQGTLNVILKSISDETADAMLEALREMPLSVQINNGELLTSDAKKGTLVFIPDEKS